jgi:hypothetical protein
MMLEVIASGELSWLPEEASEWSNQEQIAALNEVERALNFAESLARAPQRYGRLLFQFRRNRELLPTWVMDAHRESAAASEPSNILRAA